MKFLLMQALCVSCLAEAFAQPAPAAEIGRTLASIVSPEVHNDGRVSFRLLAPKAGVVELKGDWSAAPEKMSQDESGLWTISVAALAPATYIYEFVVDGIPMADPINPRIKLRMRTSASLVEVPSPQPGLADARDVPHGRLEINWLPSTVMDGRTQEVWVYTPPEYSERPTARYPVLYLYHGNNDRPAGWMDVGNLQFIADNLIAEKKMKPMIIVLPFLHLLPYGRPETAPRTNPVVSEEFLLKDLMPFVQTNYRLADGRQSRAVAGFSLGGAQALRVVFNNLDRFSAIGAFSPGTNHGLQTNNEAQLKDAEGTNAKLAVLWLACGRKDRLFAPTEKLSEAFTSRGIKHTWVPTEGTHNYAQLREHLIAFLPLLFQENER